MQSNDLGISKYLKGDGRKRRWIYPATSFDFDQVSIHHQICLMGLCKQLFLWKGERYRYSSAQSEGILCIHIFFQDGFSGECWSLSSLSEVFRRTYNLCQTSILLSFHKHLRFFKQRSSAVTIPIIVPLIQSFI